MLWMELINQSYFEMNGVIKTAHEALACKSSAIGPSDGSKIASKKTPLLNRLYKARSMIMHKLVSEAMKCSQSEKTQLLLLGAGLDHSYNGYSTSVFAVDFKDVFENRQFPKHVHTVPCDLRDSEAVVLALKDKGFHSNFPTVILLECVLSYLDEKSSHDLLNILTSTIPNCTIILYEPVLPYDDINNSGFAYKMHSKFTEREAPLLSCSKSLEEFTSRLYSTGFLHVNTTTINHALKLYLSSSERLNCCLNEPFDEFSSLALLQNYYIACIASTSTEWMKRLLTITTKHTTTTATKHSNSSDTTAQTDITAVTKHTYDNSDSSYENRLLQLQLRASAVELRLSCLEKQQANSAAKTQENR